MKQNNDQAITWVIFVPVPIDRLTTEIRKVQLELNRETKDTQFQWDIIAGTGDYSAILDREPGSEGIDYLLAEKISKGLPELTYLLRLREDLETVWAFENGRFIQEINVNPYRFAEKLQCLLPEASQLSLEGKMRSLCVVEGIASEQVKNILSFLAANPLIHIESNSIGTIIYADNGETGVFLYDLAEAFPNAVVYRVISGPSPGRFGVKIVKGEEDLGIFEIPAITGGDTPVLSAIKDRTTPPDIAEVLGIPLNLLF